MSTAAETQLLHEAARRRTFAIISHPDAGKTTLTEKLLLYAGAVGEAGSVTARKGQKAATSDWMEVEKRRGISVTSTVLRFEHDDVVFNLLDTPGHKDFSEDTLRVLAAVDAAVILIDAARGVEPQTEQLFQVARARRIPLIAFVNKYDRPGMEPLGMVDHLTETLGLPLVPITWPVGLPGSFHGVIDQRNGSFHQFTRVTGGSAMALETVMAREDAESAGDETWAVADEELELVGEFADEFDAEAFAAGEMIPMLFGSAAWNFGVGLLLDVLRELAPSAQPRALDDGTLRPVEAPFAALVFKVQANMDPRHRDRVAFVRICSGPVRARHAGDERAHRAHARAELRARGVRAGPRLDRRGVPRGRRGRGHRRRRARGGHAAPRRDGALPADPDAHAGVVRDHLQPRRRTATSSSAAGSSSSTRRASSTSCGASTARTRCPCWRASARCSSRSPSSG